MGLSGPYVPESEEEMELLEDLNTATRRAHRRGLSKRRIAALCAFMASATLDPASEQDADSERQTMAEAMQEGDKECPLCGEEAFSAAFEMGKPVEIKHSEDDDDPCEYEPESRDEMPGWMK